MKGKLRKIIIIFAGIIATLAMSSACFAATLGTDGSIETNETTLEVPKILKVYNDTLSKVGGPGVTYSYTFNYGQYTTNDGSTNDSVSVPNDAITATSVSFPNTELLDASMNGTKNSKNVTITVNPNKFSEPGIYSYLIEETISGNSGAIVQYGKTSNRTRLLIGIEYGSGSGQFKIGGYAIESGDYKINELVLGSGIRDETNTLEELLTSGVDNKMDYDAYPTENIGVKNVTKGTGADANSEWSTVGTISNLNGVKYFSKAGSSITPPTEISDFSDSDTISTTLKNGDTFFIYGLPVNTTISWSETNGTEDTYESTLAANPSNFEETYSEGSGLETAVIYPNGNYGSDYTGLICRTTEHPSKYITFVNSRDSVTPTGVVTRYGIPIFIILAMIGLFAVYRRAKKIQLQ